MLNFELKTQGEKSASTLFNGRIRVGEILHFVQDDNRLRVILSAAKNLS